MSVIGAPETLAEFVQIEINPDKSITLANIASAIKTYPLNNKLKSKVVASGKHAGVGSVRGVDLPVKQAIGPYRDSFAITHFIDCIMGWEGDFDWELILANIQQGNVAQLPEPFKPKETIANGFVLNMSIIKQGNNKYDIWKYYEFNEKTPLNVATKMCYGEALLVDFGTLKKVGPKAFKFMFTRMGGAQVLHYKFNEKPSEKTEDPENIIAGYKFIEKSAPRIQRQNVQNIWTRLQLTDPESPVYNWTRADIKEAMANIRTTMGHADITREFPCTWWDLTPAIQNAILIVILSFLRKGVLFLGRPGCGKTPTMYILGLAMSRINQWLDDVMVIDAMVRIANDPEHFKDEAGSKYLSVGLDDCDFNKFSMMALKAHFEMEAKHTVVKARWTSSVSVQGQFSMGGENKWDPDHEPTITVTEPQGNPFSSDEKVVKKVRDFVKYKGMSEEGFKKMTRPAFLPEALEDDIDAVLKRTNVFVNTETDIYLRPAGSKDNGDDVTVIRIHMDGQKYLTPAAINKLKAWTEQGKMPEDHDEAIAKDSSYNLASSPPH